MEAFTVHKGIGVPLRRSNVDTDQIIPAVYLKRVTRTGFEDGLFAGWRADPEFILNTAPTGSSPRCERASRRDRGRFGRRLWTDPVVRRHLGGPV
ncbi:hypothetical protein ACFWF3_31960, partial [Nocardia sp. NPDC060220]